MDDEIKRRAIRALMRGAESNMPPGPAALAGRLGVSEAEAESLAGELVSEGLFRVIYDSSPEGVPGPLYEQTPKLWGELERLGI